MMLFLFTTLFLSLSCLFAADSTPYGQIPEQYRDLSTAVYEEGCDSPAGLREIAAKVRGHRRSSFTAELGDVLQNFSDPDDLAAGMTVAADGGWVVKGRLGTASGPDNRPNPLHPDGKDLLRRIGPIGIAYEQGRALAESPMLAAYGTGYSVVLRAQLDSGKITREQYNEALQKTEEMLDSWGVPPMKITPDQGTHRVAIARYINALAKERGLKLQALETVLLPYKGTITPQQAGDTGVGAHPFDDEHYAVVSLRARQVKDGPSFSVDPQDLSKGVYISQQDPENIRLLLELTEKGLVTDPHAGNIIKAFLPGETEPRFVVIDVEDILRANRGDRLRSTELVGGLMKLEFLALRNPEMKTLVESAKNKHHLWARKWYALTSSLFWAFLGYKAAAWFTLSSRSSLLQGFAQGLAKDSNLDDQVALFLKKIGQKSSSKKERSLISNYLSYQKVGSKKESRKQKKVLKELRGIWWKEFSLRQKMWNMFTLAYKFMSGSTKQKEVE